MAIKPEGSIGSPDVETKAAQAKTKPAEFTDEMSMSCYLASMKKEAPPVATEEKPAKSSRKRG